MKVRTIHWLLLNAVGVGMFLLVASGSWVEPELAHISGASGGSVFIWALGALPIFAGFVLLNSGVLVASVLRREGQSVSRRSLIALLMWAIAFVIEGMQHGT